MKKHLLSLAVGILLSGTLPQNALSQESDKFLDFDPPPRPNPECLVRWTDYLQGHRCSTSIVRSRVRSYDYPQPHLLPSVEFGYIDTCGKGVFAYTFTTTQGGRPDDWSDCIELNLTIRTQENGKEYPLNVPFSPSVFELWYLEDTLFIGARTHVNTGSGRQFFCSDERWSVLVSRPSTKEGMIEVFPEDIDTPALIEFRDFCEMLRRRYNTSFFVNKNRNIYADDIFIEVPHQSSGNYLAQYIDRLPNVHPLAGSFMDFSIRSPTSVEEIPLHSTVSAYYRPATREVYVKVEKEISSSTVEIVTLRGEVVYQASAGDFLNGQTIPVGHLPIGVYFVRHGNSAKKLMIGE